MNQQNSQKSRATMVFLLIPFSGMAHVGLGWILGGQNQWPVVELIVICAALIVLFRMLRLSGTSRFWLLSLNIAGWLIAVGFLWWTQSYSSYPERAPKIRIGAQVMGLPAVAPANQATGTAAPDPIDEKPVSNNEKKPVGIKLSVVEEEEEEVFLDASGKVFQLKVAPTPEKKAESVPAPPKEVVLSGKEKLQPSRPSSSATLLVFLRGWW